MKLTGETKLFLGIIVATLSIIVGGVFLFSKPATPEPQIPREKLVTPDAHTKGNASASAYLVEFSDFQCPACRDAKPFVDATVEKNKDQFLFVYRHFPLDQHPFGERAAIAAEAAGAVGKFWEAYDFLFQNQEKFSDDFLNSFAKQLKLDEKKYQTALADETQKNKVITDRTEGLSLGVNSTPTFFLNGRKLSLTSFADLEKLVGEAIKSPQ